MAKENAWTWANLAHEEKGFSNIDLKLVCLCHQCKCSLLWVKAQLDINTVWEVTVLLKHVDAKGTHQFNVFALSGLSVSKVQASVSLLLINYATIVVCEIQPKNDSFWISQ